MQALDNRLWSEIQGEAFPLAALGLAFALAAGVIIFSGSMMVRFGK